MSQRPRYAFIIMAFTLPIVLADAAPHCGNGPRREPPADTTGGDSVRADVAPDARLTEAALQIGVRDAS